jgi:YkoY family integral membrane protein
MDILHRLLGHDPTAGLLVILNLILIESVLSVDNAAVLATMVMRLPHAQRGKALRIGLLVGYVFRGACLVLANKLMSIWWLGPLGGLYLLWLAGKHFAKHEHIELETTGAETDEGNWIYRSVIVMMGPFWATVLSVELMDLAFSIDNVLAASAYTKNIYLVCGGVFIGILVMRFAAQGFVTLMHHFPYLETCAFVVVGLLGLKLNAEIVTTLIPASAVAHWMESNVFKIGWSALTLAVFAVPLATSRLFGWPRVRAKSPSGDGES